MTQKFDDFCGAVDEQPASDAYKVAGLICEKNIFTGLLEHIRWFILQHLRKIAGKITIKVRSESIL